MDGRGLLVACDVRDRRIDLLRRTVAASGPANLMPLILDAVRAYATVGVELLSVVPSHGLWVDANFKESQLKNIHPGSPVRVAADALPGERLLGRVVSISPATGAQFSVLPAENATGNFTKIVQRVPVRILLEGDASTLGRLRPGLSVSAYVDGRQDHIEGTRTALLVP